MLLFAACTPAGLPPQGIEATIATLTDESLEGRFVGSQGNRLAAEWLETQLEALGAEPFFADSFALPFTLNVPQFTSDEMLLIPQDGQQVRLLPGEHYLPPVNAVGFVLEGAITTTGEGLALKQADGSLTSLQENLKRSSDWLTSGAPKAISLTTEGYTLLSQNEGAQLRWETTAKENHVALDNIVGVLRGGDSRSAVVLGAHFDHMGMVGPLLYSGALDNASGVAAVLETARLLAGQELPMDVVVCFWNSEEYNFLVGSNQGSMPVVDAYDEICYINIDCVGLASLGKACISTVNGSTALVEAITSAMAENGYGLQPDEDSMASDHISFSAVSSVNIGHRMADIADTIHYPYDTAGMLDTTDIALLAESLAKTIAAEGKTLARLLPDVSQSTGSMQGAIGIELPEGDYAAMTREEQWQYTDAILAQLEPDEFIILELEDIRLYIAPAPPLFYSIEAMQAAFPLAPEIPQAIGTYSLATIGVHGQYSSDVAGQVIKRDFSTETVGRLSLLYHDETTGATLNIQYEAVYSGAPLPGDALYQEDSYSIYSLDGGETLSAYIRKGYGLWVSPGEFYLTEEGPPMSLQRPETLEGICALAEYVLEHLE